MINPHPYTFGSTSEIQWKRQEGGKEEREGRREGVAGEEEGKISMHEVGKRSL